MSAQAFDTKLPPEYTNVEPIGSGGFGQVFKALNEKTSRLEAVKLLSVGNVDETKIERMKREALALSQLDHANIVKVYRFGNCPDGTPFIAYEFLDGITLQQRLDERPLSDEEFRFLFKQLLQGLDCAHKAGVIHRDIKPSNIMLVWLPSGTTNLKILDFGIAKVVTSQAQNLTQDGTILGSPEYMSPEQCAGSAVDERADLYSVGCIMYRALAGQVPFTGESALHVLYKQMNDAPPPLVNATAEIANLIISSLEKDPKKRPASACDFLEQLIAIKSGLRLNEQKSRQRKIAVVTTVLLLLLMLVGVAWFSRSREVRSSTPPLRVQYHTLLTAKPDDPDEKFKRLLDELNLQQAQSEQTNKFAVQFCKGYLYYSLFSFAAQSKRNYFGMNQEQLAMRADQELDKALTMAFVNGRLSTSAVPILRYQAHIRFFLRKDEEATRIHLAALDLLDPDPAKQAPELNLPFQLDFRPNTVERLTVYYFLSRGLLEAHKPALAEKYARLGWQEGHSHIRDSSRWEATQVGLTLAKAQADQFKYKESKATCDQIKTELFTRPQDFNRTPLTKALHLARQLRCLGFNKESSEVLKFGLASQVLPDDPLRNEMKQELAQVELLIKEKGEEPGW